MADMPATAGAPVGKTAQGITPPVAPPPSQTAASYHCTHGFDKLRLIDARDWNALQLKLIAIPGHADLIQFGINPTNGHYWALIKLKG